MKRYFIVAAAALVASCGNETSRSEQEEIAETERAIVAAEGPPAIAIEPQEMTFADFERNAIYGAGCSFALREGGEAIAVALGEAGYLKVDGEVARFAPDSGSEENPLGTRSRYDGLEHGFHLAIEPDDGAEAANYPARLTVYDARNRVVYEAEGRASCGA